MIPWARAGGSFPAETIYLFSVVGCGYSRHNLCLLDRVFCDLKTLPREKLK